MEKEFVEIKSLLEERDVDFELRVHDAARTSEEAAKIRGVALRSGVKSLVFCCGDEHVLVLVRGDKRADTKRLRKLTGHSDIRLASPAEVKRVCGCEPGAVHPFGNLMNVDRVLADRSILENDSVNLTAGLATHTIRMKARDLFDVVGPEVADVTEHG